ncbi:MAG: AEC family transporter [Kineosporiaceae bacterium]
MRGFAEAVRLASPLFVLAALGYALGRRPRWSAAADPLTTFVFRVALPASLFRLLSAPAAAAGVDARLLIAFFGGCGVVFVVGRLIGRFVLRLDGVEQSVLALGGVFSNNLLLGLPLAATLLGHAAVPAVALVLVFNSLTLWTLATASVEWARQGSVSARGVADTVRAVLTTPVVVGILAGGALGLTGRTLPQVVDAPLGLLAGTAAPLALVALGMGLARYDVREGWAATVAICGLKLLVQPAVVWALAVAIGLPALETRAVVLLASLAVGANVYVMAQEFRALRGPVAASLVLSTALAALTTPAWLAFVG